MLSINQTISQIKLQEARKANKDQDYPIKLKNETIMEEEEPDRNTRGSNREAMIERGKQNKQRAAL